MSNQNSKSFTLIELLIVLAIIAILATVLILTIKPGAIFSRARDTKRIGDLKNIEKIMDAIYSTEYTFNELNYASPNVIYISLKDNSPTCSSWLSQLPSLPSGWSYRYSAKPTNIDGTGWIPIPFSNFPILNISQLFIDPINKPPYYYSFVAGGSYAVYAQLEDPKNQASKNDQDNYPHLFSAGTDKRLIDQVQGLVGYWPFDEGSGTTAKDYSGNGNNGTLCNGTTCGVQGPTWAIGKVGGALSFDGVNDYVGLGNPSSLNFSGQITLEAWIKPQATDGLRNIVAHGYGLSPNREVFFRIYSGLYQVGSWDGNGYLTSYAIPAEDINNWVHLVGLYDGSNWKLYRNGIAVSSASYSVGAITVNEN
jgi:prepilin-type N-terminal cleavage/methylation domain-containing protein